MPKKYPPEFKRDVVADKMDEQFRDSESESEVTGTNSVRAFKV